MSSVLEVINHYRKSIEKSHDDEVRLLHCIGKLYKLPVTIQHLQETGIGKTVNFLRKFDGEVGVAAKALVTKWKAMVAAEESSESDNEGIPDDKSDDDNSSSDKEMEHNKINENHLKAEKIIKETREHKNSNQHEKERHRDKEKQHSSRNKDIKSNGEIKMKHSNSEHHHSSSRSHHSSSSSHNHNSKNSDYKKDSQSSSQKHSDTNITSKSSNHSRKLNSHNNSSSTSGKKRRHSNSDNEDDKLIIDFEIKEEKLSDNEMYNTKLENKKEQHQSQPDKIIKTEIVNHKHNSSNNHNSHSYSSKHKIKEERDEKEHHHKTKDSSSKSSNHDSHRSSSKSKHKEKRKIESEDDNEENKLKSSNGSSSSHRKHHEKSSSSSSSKNRSKSDKHDKSHSSSSSSSSSKKRKVTSDIDDEIENNLNEPITKVDDGIDYTTGASFAEALGMIEKPKSSSTKSSSKKKSSSNTPSSSSTPIASGSGSYSTSKVHSEKMEMPSTSSSSSTPYLLAPTVKLKPLETELQLELTTITNNYKPMPLNPIIMDCVFSCNRPTKKNMTADEALCDSISSRTTRTKIYSGMKTAGPLFVPSLHELCIRILQKNIDALEYTGGVPFDILKPVLERASAEQLFNFEDFNPYLIDDSDVLWQLHCNRKFRGHKRQGHETWREMFIRCLQEQEAKLMSLTENIKLSQVASVPVKQTKLAYVDSAAKPPRSVQRKQHQYGTDRKLIATPAARVASLSNLTSNIGKVGDARLRVLGTGRDTAQVQPLMFKPKKAPLMAKTIQLMKGRYKR